MPGPIEAAGAARDQTRYAALTMGARQMTGVWTQRSPYRDADVQYLVSKFYGGSRFDSIWDGINREITQKMTDGRRPGSVIYNPNLFPAASSFYSWKYIQGTNEIVRVILDGANGIIYDATAGQKSILFTKSAGSGDAWFLGVATELFIGDGVDQVKILRSSLPWAATTEFTVGNFIIDDNGNIQSFQSQATTLNITALQVEQKTAGMATQSFLVVTLDAPAPTIPPNQPITFSGIAAPAFAPLNGAIVNYSNLDPGWNLSLAPDQFALATVLGVEGSTATTGTASTYIQQDENGNNLTGITGSAPPTWGTGQGEITQDGTVTWMCFGNPAQNWGVAAPTVAPILAPGPTTQYWSPYLSLLGKPQYGYTIMDANNQLQVAFGIGVTGDEQPIWNTVLGGKTGDGSVVWMNVGQVQVWYPDYQYGSTVVAIIDPNGNLQVTTDYFTTQTIWTAGTANTTGAGNTTGSNQPGAVIPAQSRGSSYYLQSNAPGNDTTAGTNVTVYYSDATTSGPDTNLVNAFNAFLAGGPEVILNFSFTGIPSPIGPENVVVTSVGEGQPPTQPRNFYFFTFTTGTSAIVYWQGSGHPGYTANYVGVHGTTTWNPILGGKTTDNAYTWVNCGPATQLTAGTLQYAQCYHSIDGTVSTASPVSYILNPMVGAPGMFGVYVTLTPSTDPQVDQIWLMRTAGGKPTLVYVDQIPNVGPNATFTYLDIIPDTSTSGQQALNPFIPAPVAKEGDPPPKGLTGMVYTLSRTWGYIGNLLYYSAGPDAVTGNGNTQWPPDNFLPCPSAIKILFPVTVENGGMLVFTTSGVFIVLGTGTPDNPFYMTSYFPSVNVTGIYAGAIYNNSIFIMESNCKVSQLAIEYPFNPQTGYNEVGFPIGDQLVYNTTGGIEGAIFNPATAYLTWNMANSGDTGLYVSNGEGEWWRLSFVPPPESGLLWSPLASIQGGTSAVQSIETFPGNHALLMGPPLLNLPKSDGEVGPILMRDTTGENYTDNSEPYPSWDAKGVNLLCSTGQWADVAHISAKSTAVGARPIISVLFGEIHPSSTRPYNVLDVTGPDPPEQPPSESVFSDRYNLAQNGMSDTGDCILTRFDYGIQDEPDELLDWGIFAAVHDERVEQAEKA